MLIPANEHTELDKIAHGLVKTLQKQKVSTKLFQPVNQKRKRLKHTIHISQVYNLFSQGMRDKLLEDIAAMHDCVGHNTEVVVVKGATFLPSQHYIPIINMFIADALDAKIIIVANLKNIKLAEIDSVIGIALNVYQANRIKQRVLGCILDRTNIIPNAIRHETEFIACIPNKPRITINFIANQFDPNWIKKTITADYPKHLSTAMFRYNLITAARKAHKKIVLPEGEQPRIISAAIICTKRKLAHCILLGTPTTIKRLAKQKHLVLTNKIEIIDPETIAEKYVKPMVKLRKNKGLTEQEARKQLQDKTVLATMMLAQGDVDGLVAGISHTTADTIRPALQLIKTLPKTKLVSSVFFMCLPLQVLVYADCAVVPNPTAEQLAIIAIESADSAKLFGIIPKVAMISYSTHHSGAGADVKKVIQATNIVKRKRPDIIIDGPLQYDAAIDETVAKLKAPQSPVAGRATVFIFPDLNTGNALYKAVQRSTNILSIGPMLQGLKKPMNDISRGASVKDIVFTIALTAVQGVKKP